MELPHPLQKNIQLRKLCLSIQHFVVLQLRHTTFITQSLKEIYSGRETGLIDTGPLNIKVTYLSILCLVLRFSQPTEIVKYLKNSKFKHQSDISQYLMPCSKILSAN